MDAVRQYVLSVICVCILSCMLQLLFAGNSHMTPLIKMCTGLALTLTVFMPIIQMKVLKFDVQMDGLIADSRGVVEKGEASALESLTAIIKENTEAYIIEKANELGMNIHAEVTLSDDDLPAPCAVIIKGMCTPFARKQLSAYLQQNLGISEEYQTWIS